MSGEQGTIRAIRVICGENGSEDWPQRGAEGAKRRRRFEPLICANLEPRIAHGTHGGRSQNFLLRMSRRSRMSGDQGNIRAIRVICGENSSEDWPQRGAEGTKRRRHFEPLICANLEPRIAHGTHGGRSQNFLLRMSRRSRMSGDQGNIRAIRVICGENSSEDWPQRGTEGAKRRRRFEPLIDANRR